MSGKAEAIGTRNGDDYCYHCHEPVQGRAYRLDEQSDKLFCCVGCRAVYRSIHEFGCEDYYQYRTEVATPVELTIDAVDSSEVEGYEWADDLIDQLDFVEKSSESEAGLYKAQLTVGGMRCSACAWLIESSLQKLIGVEDAQVNLSNDKLEVLWRQQQTPLSQIMAHVAAFGYEPSGWSQQARWNLFREKKAEISRYLGVSGIIMMQVGMLSIGLYAGELSNSMSTITLEILRYACLLLSSFSLVYCGKPFYVSAIRGLANKSINMDVPIVIALTMAYSYSVFATLKHAGDVYFDTVAMFLFFLWLSRFIEYQSRGDYQRQEDAGLPTLVQRIKALNTDVEANATANLTDAIDKNIVGVVQEELETIPLANLKLNDYILCKRGDTVAADGVLVSESAELDTAAFTGESLPINLDRHESICAGSVNAGNPIWLRVTSQYGQSSFDRLQSLAASAQGEKPHYQKIIDQISPYFTFVVLLVAVFVAVYWWQVDSSKMLHAVMAVLIVSCPCALSLATPLAMAVANRVSREASVLITDTRVWSELSKVTDIVFDKTGTLTEPSKQDLKVISDKMEVKKALQIAASLESLSSHPLAKVFLAENKMPLLEVSEFNVVDGCGIEGVIDEQHYVLGSASWISRFLSEELVCTEEVMQSDVVLFSRHRLGNTELAGFQLREIVVPDVDATVNELHSLGFHIHILSGDSLSKVEAVAQRLQCDSFYAGLRPADKLQSLERLQAQGKRILAVGDGVNDAPLLAAADVSVAVSNASSLAESRADLLLCKHGIKGILDAFSIAKLARKTILTNCLWSICYNLIAVGFAAAALVPPYLAAIGMTLSSLIVLLNSRSIRYAHLKALDSRELESSEFVHARNFSVRQKLSAGG